jgi:hypothetical protein
VPFTQLAAEPHTLPHAPQFDGSLAVLMQVPEHGTWPNGHEQIPLKQICPPEHTALHRPQFSGSTLVSTQLAPH